MEVQNSKSEFVTNLSKLGYPVWDKCPTIYSAPALNSFGEEHLIMATDYHTKFKTELLKFYNKSAPSAIRDSVIQALAFTGLRETSVWKKLPSWGIDTCKYRAYQVAATRSSTGSVTPIGCSSMTIHYSDSLKLTTGCN